MHYPYRYGVYKETKVARGSPEVWNYGTNYGKSAFEDKYFKGEFIEHPIINSKRSPEAEPGGKGISFFTLLYIKNSFL